MTVNLRLARNTNKRVLLARNQDGCNGFKSVPSTPRVRGIEANLRNGLSDMLSGDVDDRTFPEGVLEYSSTVIPRARWYLPPMPSDRR